MSNCPSFIVGVIYVSGPFVFITTRKRSLGQGNVCIRVCHSVYGGGAYPSIHLSRGVCITAWTWVGRSCGQGGVERTVWGWNRGCGQDV